MTKVPSSSVSCQLSLKDLDKIRYILKARFRLYAWRYIAYTRLRGFKSFNDWPYHRRGFLECWAEPGFHKFWQVWNPGIAYFVFCIYMKLGGNKRPAITTLLSFEINGLIHAIVFYLFSGQWSFVIPVLFFIFGMLTVISKWLEPLLLQNRWPWLLNTVVNIGLVLYSFDISFTLNRIIIEMLRH